MKIQVAYNRKWFIKAIGDSRELELEEFEWKDFIYAILVVLDDSVKRVFVLEENLSRIPYGKFEECYIKSVKPSFELQQSFTDEDVIEDTLSHFLQNFENQVGTLKEINIAKVKTVGCTEI